MAEGLLKRGLRFLRFLVRETIVFTTGVELAEANPEAAVLLAKTCMGLVAEAMEQLKGLGEDEEIVRAYKELEKARDLFASAVVGEPISFIARRSIPQGAEGRRVLILDIAHSHTHRAIDMLRRSKKLESYEAPLGLLSKARRESAPTTLYRLAYELAQQSIDHRNA
ncbi:hypothetical protein KEJ36_05645 [Candidatus Bathyarchaeota archaeon]|nr:hypothetical protein [Candidatus Bathyarchaeota archaeon]MBS7628264.1 hypothetical protein [Candidatus Bathyarchaeota archaeon]